MYNHIVPRVLLKQFIDDYPRNRIVKYLDSDLKEHRGNIRRVSGEEGFYSDEKELELGKYESRFGEIIAKIKTLTRQKYVSLTYSEYCNILEFYTIQWRRTQYGRESKRNLLLDYSEKMYHYFDNLGFKKVEGASKEKMFEAIQKEYDENEETVIDIYEDEYDSITGVLFKSLNFYTPFLVQNKSKLKFCLHDKVLTAINPIEQAGTEFPDTLIYPLTKDVTLMLQRSKKYVIEDRNVNIKVLKLKSEKEVKNLLRNYILGSSKEVYYINGADFIKEVYTEKQKLMKKLGYDNL